MQNEKRRLSNLSEWFDNHSHVWSMKLAQITYQNQIKETEKYVNESKQGTAFSQQHSYSRYLSNAINFMNLTNVIDWKKENISSLSYGSIPILICW